MRIFRFSYVRPFSWRPILTKAHTSVEGGERERRNIFSSASRLLVPPLSLLSPSLFFATSPHRQNHSNMRRIATTSRTTLNRASRASLARSTSRVSSSGVSSSTATPRINVGCRSLASKYSDSLYELDPTDLGSFGEQQSQIPTCPLLLLLPRPSLANPYSRKS